MISHATLTVFNSPFSSLLSNVIYTTNYSGALASLSFYQPYLNAYTHVETEKLFHCAGQEKSNQLQSSSYSFCGENQENEKSSTFQHFC